MAVPPRDLQVLSATGNEHAFPVAEGTCKSVGGTAMQTSALVIQHISENSCGLPSVHHHTVWGLLSH